MVGQSVSFVLNLGRSRLFARVCAHCEEDCAAPAGEDVPLARGSRSAPVRRLGDTPCSSPSGPRFRRKCLHPRHLWAAVLVSHRAEHAKRDPASSRRPAERCEMARRRAAATQSPASRGAGRAQRRRARTARPSPWPATRRVPRISPGRRIGTHALRALAQQRRLAIRRTGTDRLQRARDATRDELILARRMRVLMSRHRALAHLAGASRTPRAARAR